DISESCDPGAAAIGIWQHVGAVGDAAPGHRLALRYRAANNGHLAWPQSTWRWSTHSMIAPHVAGGNLHDFACDLASHLWSFAHRSRHRREIWANVTAVRRRWQVG